MPGYLETESANAMMKAMMLNSSCNHIKGDDTNTNGFKLIVDDPADQDCKCQIVRSIGAGRNTRLRIANNN